MNQHNTQWSAQNLLSCEGESDLVPSTPMAPPPETEAPLEAHSIACNRYIRRYSHDVGNCLLVIDLLTLVLQGSVNTPGESKHLATVRKQIACVAAMQLRLGLRFRAPNSIAISLSSFVEQCRSQQRVGSSEHAIDWSFDGADYCFLGDAPAVSIILVEIADHWFAHGGGTIGAYARDGNVCFQMQRADASTSTPCLPGMDNEVQAELASLVARFGGTLVIDVDNIHVTVMFPQASS